MLLPSLPAEDGPPVYEDVGTLMIPTRAAARPAVRGNQVRGGGVRSRRAGFGTAGRGAEEEAELRELY